MESQEASGDAALKVRIAELEAENARLRAARSEGPDIRGVADALPVLLAYIDRNQRYRFNNRAYEEWFGHRREDLAGKHMREVLGEAAYEGLRPMVERVLQGEKHSFEQFVPYKDGGPRHVAIDYVPDRRGDTIAGFFALVRDISERKRAEQALRESEARFRAMADSAPVPAWVTGPDGIEFANQAFAEYAGRPSEQLTGQVWTEIIHPDDLAGVAARRAAAWEKGEPYGFEARFRRGDGEWRWLMVSSRPRRDPDGTLLGYVGMAVDLTDIHAATEALRESEERYRSLFSAIDAGFCIIEVEFAPSGEAVDHPFLQGNPAF